MGLSAITLNDPNQVMFSKHVSFTDASHHFDRPNLSPTHKLLQLLLEKDTSSIQQKALGNEWAPILCSIFQAVDQLKPMKTASEVVTDSPFITQVMRTFIDNVNHTTYEQVQLECGTDKKVFGGALDSMIALHTNGNRPFMLLNTTLQPISVYFGSLCESKHSNQGMMKKSNEVSLFTEESEDIKAIIQPSLQVMAFAEKCIFPDPNVPLLLLYACRFHYRPFLYFKEHDVLLTSPTTLPKRETYTLLASCHFNSSSDFTTFHSMVKS